MMIPKSVSDLFVARLSGSVVLLSLVWGVVVTDTASAAWRTQVVALSPGWNAIFLEVTPQPSTPQEVFQGLPVESVWMWKPNHSPVQFVQDPYTLEERALLGDDVGWLGYLPAAPELTTLFSILGGRAYLVHLRGDSSVEMEISGSSLIRPTEWVADSFNLAGFYVHPEDPPTFGAMLAGSNVHDMDRVYQLDAAGRWERLLLASSERVSSGRAYWIYVDGGSEYPGPLELKLEQGGKIDFGRTLIEQVLRVGNRSGSGRAVTIRPTVSEKPKDGSSTLAGGVPLSYWDAEGLRWIEFSSALQTMVGAGDQFEMRISVRRQDMAESPDPGAVYGSFLEVSDGQGLRRMVPVVARGLSSVDSGPTSLGASLSGVEAAMPRQGLWVGAAVIDRVSHATSSDPAALAASASEMTIRVILHVDAEGRARLLPHVTLMWKDGTNKPDPEDPELTVVDEPGRLVLVSRDDLLPRFSGAALRDGKQVGRRISSAAFSGGDVVELDGAFDAVLSTKSMRLGYDDPLNPFKHRYHPNHDNLNFDFESTLVEGEESYDIVRSVEFRFSGEDPEGLALPGWGDSQVGGEYVESIRGLNKETIHAAGTFRLHHVSRVGVLNDGI